MQFPAEDLRCLIVGGSWMAQFDQLHLVVSLVAPNGMIANLYGPVGETFHIHDLIVDQ